MTAPSTLTVTGSGRVMVAPDTVVFRWSLAVQRSSITVVRSELEDIRQRLIAGLRAAKVDGDYVERVRRSELRIAPSYTYRASERICEGYVGRETWTLRLPVQDGGLARLLGAIDAKDVVGVEVDHEIGDAVAGQSEALRRAVANARERAEVIANIAGMQLGPLLEIRDQTEPDRGWTSRSICSEPSRERFDADPDEIPFDASVSVVWTLVASDRVGTDA